MLETCRLCSEHLQVGLPELGPRIVSHHRDPALRKFEETLFEVQEFRFSKKAAGSTLVATSRDI
jgi:hypothetical protein